MVVSLPVKQSYGGSNPPSPARIVMGSMLGSTLDCLVSDNIHLS